MIQLVLWLNSIAALVSICHGVPQSDCWPNLIKDYFRNAFDSLPGRSRPITEAINLSQPATGSSYFSYCLPIEKKLRSGGRLGKKGPDLVILEFGINDVWPINEVAKKDVERLLRVLRGGESQPAVIILDAASLKLADTYTTEENPESLHLPAATYYDVPVLSVKAAMFGPTFTPTPEEATKYNDLFLDDRHHPNSAGHKVLLDVLITYIEEQACNVQAQLLEEAAKRSQGGAIKVNLTLDAGMDKVQPMPTTSLFQLVSDGSQVSSDRLVDSTCSAVGTADAGVTPSLNEGYAVSF